MVKLDSNVGSCNTLNDLSNKICVPNKAVDLNLSVSKIVIGINESKTLTKYILCKCKCRFDGRKGSSDEWWNNHKCRCEYKKHNVCEKDYVWNHFTCNCENGKNLASIMDKSEVICNDVMESYNEDVEAKSNSEKKNSSNKF